MKIELAQIFTQIIAFLIMYWVLKRYAWKPLLKIMDDRRDKIQGEFDAIDAEKKEISRAKQEYQEKLEAIEAKAQGILREANDKGEKIFKNIEKEAHKEARAITERARAELQNEIFKAKILLKNELVNVTLLATEKIIKSGVDPEKQRKYISEFVEQAEIH